MFSIKKLNNEVVKEISLKTPKDTRLPKGYRLFAEPDSNIFICAKKHSGKSTVISTAIRKCAGPNTKIIVFCATLDLDKNWIAIQDWANEKGISFTGYTSIKENKVDQLKAVVEELKARRAEEKRLAKEDEVKSRRGFTVEKDKDILSWESDEEEDEEPRRSKYQEPEYIFILDDISTEIKNPSVAELLKINRHFHSKTIVSAQYLNDMSPSARLQLDYYLIFRGLPRDKIDDIYSKADLSLPKADFYKMYLFATNEPYSFLYVDVRHDSFRRNFNTLIQL